MNLKDFKMMLAESLEIAPVSHELLVEAFSADNMSDFNVAVAKMMMEAKDMEDENPGSEDSNEEETENTEKDLDFSADDVRKIIDSYPDPWKCKNMDYDDGAFTFRFERDGQVIEDHYMTNEEGELVYIFSTDGKQQTRERLYFLVGLANYSTAESTKNIINNLIRYNLYEL